MTSLFQAHLVNRPFGDPGLYVGFSHERRALLFDLGDLAPLSSRQLLKISHAFVSHAHMDHFAGFDQLLRVCLGRDKALHLFGPPGFADRVAHKLAAYTWNLVASYATDFAVTVTEVGPEGPAAAAEFRCRGEFARQAAEPARLADDALVDEDAFRVRAAVLDHGVPCLAFALEETAHVNVWKNRLAEMGLPVGPWLRELKAAVIRGDPPETRIRVRWREGGTEHRRDVVLGRLATEALRVAPGRKIAYVVDAVYSRANVERVVELAHGADILFIEAVFLDRDRDRAQARRHLTARQAGELGRLAGVKQLVPFHFSPRYMGEEARLEAEAQAAFAG